MSTAARTSEATRGTGNPDGSAGLSDLVHVVGSWVVGI